MKKNNEKGRSMVEMLGVLAIIGVLSAAGLAGYSKAMAKHRSNQIIDQFNHIQQSLQSLYARVNTYKSLAGSDGTQMAISLGVFPSDMIFTENGQQVVRHAGKGTVSLVFHDDDVSVTFHDLPKDAAIALASADFNPNWVKIENSDNN